MTIDELIDRAVKDLDLRQLQRIQDAVIEASEATQTPGQMAEHLVVSNPAALFTSLGLEGEAGTAESLGLDLANRVADALRLVEFHLDKVRRPSFETVVAEGDSWFLHQLLTDTLDHLRRDFDFNVRCIAAAGDTVKNMVTSGSYLDVLGEEQPHVFLFSGGGNDLLGDGMVAKVVRKESKSRAPHQLIDEGVFGPLLAGIGQYYEQMLAAIRRDAPEVQVFGHGYDYLVKITKGPWLWPYLQDMGYDEGRAQAVLKVILDRFNAELKRIEDANRNFTYVDMRGAVGSNPNAWYDVIHPRGPGYRRVAERLANAVRALLTRPAAASRAVFSAANRPQAPMTATGPVSLTTEAVVRAFAFNPLLTDFEAVRQAADEIERNFPDETQWLPFDALTRRHIRDVLRLLRETGKDQEPEQTLLANRLATQPANARARGTGEATVASLLMDGPAAVNEALVGASEIEPIQILMQGYRTARCVGRIQVMSPQRVHVMHGSGFLVGPALLLTNHHVLPDADTAARSYVIFDDEVPLDGSLPHPRRFRITPDIYFASAELDYAFASVETVNRDGDTLADCGYLPLIEIPGKAIRYEPISIIQHPGGDPKAIAMRNSFVMGRVDDGIYYTTDTRGGSSGSPVLNREWQVVALHHRYVPHPTERSGVLANRGVRISAIYEDLRQAQARGGAVAARVLQRLTAVSTGPVEGEATPPAGAGLTAEAAGDEGAWVADGVYAGLTEAEFLTAIAREEDAGSDIPLPEALAEAAARDTAEALSLDPDRVLARVGDRGYRLIVAHEVSSRAHYDANLRNPILPGGASGVTIGIGYDLGHQSLTGFRTHWEGLLPPATLRRLEVCIGKTGAAAAVTLRSVRDVLVPYEVAIKVFERDSLPRYFGMLNRHIRDDVLDALHPHCVGALVSLTYNRGASYQKEGDRFREMRAIRAALNGGEPQRVPGLIRAMKRLWVGRPGVRGLLRRRDEEADLFQAGLDAGVPRSPVEAAVVADQDYDPTPDLDEGSELTPDLPRTEEAGFRALGPADVAWVRTYSNNPDYWHLPATAEGKAFDLTADLIEELIRLGHYEPHFTAAGYLIVGIRGATLMNGEDAVIRRGGIEVMEQKPNHRSYRCVMAIYHRADRTVSAYRASTVPNRGSVAACANRLNGLGGDLANLLPTGCYELCVGIHFGSQRVPTVLRLGTGTGPDTALEVTTLRSKNDAIYGTRDLWDKCKPADNIHPGFAARTADFSSQGCMTLPGRFSGGVHSGIWAQFRKTAGFDGERHLGTRYNLVLTTGMELAAIAAAAGDSAALARLRRLAHGSRGDPVRVLQGRLGLSQDGVFAAATKKALIQTEPGFLNGAATGIYSVPLDEKTGFSVF